MERFKEQLSQLPPEFLTKIKPFIENQDPITERAVLLNIWHSAIESRNAHPEKQEIIAEWTLSTGSRSPLIDKDALLQEIHFTFGELELPEAHINLRPGKTVSDRWQELDNLIAEAESSGPSSRPGHV